MSIGLIQSYTAVSDQLASSVVTNAKLGTDIAIGARIYQIPVAADTVTQGTWAYGPNTNQSGCNNYNNNASGAVNDEVIFQVYLAAGTYTIECIGITSNDCGISTWLDGSTSLGTMDWYSAGATNNVRKTITGVAIATNGLKAIHLKMATKNGASSAYKINLCSFCFIRTA